MWECYGCLKLVQLTSFQIAGLEEHSLYRIFHNLIQTLSQSQSNIQINLPLSRSLPPPVPIK